ncbi:MAG TPA: hypothetical protein VMR14_12730 [Streptosporangiaceae bacterium]|nr:hypothetical protein [Streptosporangiaceae bacterium]
MSAPVRRGALGLILVAVILFPGGTAAMHRKACGRSNCQTNGIISWKRKLTGPWQVSDGAQGTEYSLGQAYAAIGDGVAAIGYGLTLDAFNSSTGFPRWSVTLAGVPIGSSIISVRAWPGVITAGVEVAAGSAGLPSGAAGRQPSGTAQREEIVLDAATGKQLGMHAAALLGGAVSANARQTVVVGSTAVTSYENATGKVSWRWPTGAAGQAWQVSGDSLYVTVSSGGEVGTAPVTAVRVIDLRTGVPRLIQPVSGSFNGRLSEAFDGVLLFSSAAGLSAYSEADGRLVAFRAGAVPEIADPVDKVLYVEINGVLIGIDPLTGRDDRGAKYPGPPGTYGVRAGVALGLDPGASGAAWGYSIAGKRVIWTTKALPWPHFFVDLSGIGGSIEPGSEMMLLLTCDKVGNPVSAGAVVGGSSGQICLRPTLVAIHR